MVGGRLGYPPYVLQAGAFLAGALFSCFRMPLLKKMPFEACVYDQKKPFLGVCIVKRKSQNLQECWIFAFVQSLLPKWMQCPIHSRHSWYSIRLA